MSELRNIALLFQYLISYDRYVPIFLYEKQFRVFLIQHITDTYINGFKSNRDGGISIAGFIEHNLYNIVKYTRSVAVGIGCKFSFIWINTMGYEILVFLFITHKH